MPSVLHIPQERAETILAELGLKVEIQMGQSEIESGGNVMVQEPAQNTVLQKGDTVLLTICEQQPPQIIALRVAKAPKKTSYTVGAALDTTGLVMEAEYDDGTVQTITEGFTCSPTRLNKSGRYRELRRQNGAIQGKRPGEKAQRNAGAFAQSHRCAHRNTRTQLGKLRG